MTVTRLQLSHHFLLFPSLQDRLDDISKGVLHVEADRVNRTRIDRFTGECDEAASM